VSKFDSVTQNFSHRVGKSYLQIERLKQITQDLVVGRC